MSVFTASDPPVEKNEVDLEATTDDDSEDDVATEDDDAGSLVDFIVDSNDEDDEDTGLQDAHTAAVKKPQCEALELKEDLKRDERALFDADVRPRRQRKKTKFFVEEYASEIAGVMLSDVPADELDAAIELELSDEPADADDDDDEDADADDDDDEDADADDEDEDDDDDDDDDFDNDEDSENNEDDSDNDQDNVVVVPKSDNQSEEPPVDRVEKTP